MRTKETRVGKVANLRPRHGTRVEAQRGGVCLGGDGEGSCPSPRLLYTRQTHPNYPLNTPQRNRFPSSYRLLDRCQEGNLTANPLRSGPSVIPRLPGRSGHSGISTVLQIHAYVYVQRQKHAVADALSRIPTDGYDSAPIPEDIHLVAVTSRSGSVLEPRRTDMAELLPLPLDKIVQDQEREKLCQ